MTESRIHDEVLAHADDPVYMLAMEIFLGELMQQIATYHQGQVQKICDWATERQLNRHRIQITKNYLAQRLVEVRKERVRKADERDPSWNESWWGRDASGQFAYYKGPKVHAATNRANLPPTSRGVRGANLKQVVAENWALRNPLERNSERAARGMVTPATELPIGPQSQHAIDVANLFTEMTYALSSRTQNADDRQRIQYVISSPDGYHRLVTPSTGQSLQQGVDWQPDKGERVQFMTPVGIDRPVTVAGKAINIGQIAGMSPDQAAKAGAVTQDVQDALQSTDWGTKLNTTANALRVISNNSEASIKAQAVAQVFGLFGPDSQRAFGNKLQQLSYRYLGQVPPKQYWDPVATAGRQRKSDGTLETIPEFEAKLAHTLVPSVPNKVQYKTALETGSTPPSRGFLLNRRGDVVSEAVGYADDWYTPFNLKDLPNLRGGSYVRTRGFGGITPEDLRLAMRTGAQRITVVSNNGMFTMEFDPKALHFGHRFGYTGNAVIRRYAKALDAVGGGGVHTGDTEGQTLRLDAEGYRAAMTDLQTHHPYFIRASTEATPFWRPIRDFGEAQTQRQASLGAGTGDAGYVGPLHTHANAARGGWHDSSVRDLYSDRDGKYAYESVGRSKLERDRVLGVVDRLHPGLRGQVSGAPTPQPFTRQTPGSPTPRPAGTPGGFSPSSGRFYFNNDELLVNQFGTFVDTTGRHIDRAAAVALKEERQRAGHSTTGGFTPPLTSSLSPTSEKYTPAYSGNKPLDPETTHDSLRSIRDLLEAGREDGRVSRSLINWPYLAEADRGLFPDEGKRNWTETQESDAYKELFKEVQSNPTFRQNLTQELLESFSGKYPEGYPSHVHSPDDIAEELLNVDEETGPEGVSESSGATTATYAPVMVSQLDAKAVQEWKADLSRKRKTGSPQVQEQAQRDQNEFNRYTQMLAAAERRMQDIQQNENRLPSIDEAIKPQDRPFFHKWNTTMANLLTTGYGNVDEEGRRIADSGETTMAGPVDTERIGIRTDMLRSPGTSAEDIAATEYSTIIENAQMTEEMRNERLRLRATRYLHYGKGGQRGDTDRQKALRTAQLLDDYLQGRGS